MTARPPPARPHIGLNPTTKFSSYAVNNDWGEDDAWDSASDSESTEGDLERTRDRCDTLPLDLCEAAPDWWLSIVPTEGLVLTTKAFGGLVMA